MKGKQLLILLVIVAVLGGAWFALSKRDRASWSQSSSSSGGKIVEFPINDVAKIHIKSPEGEVTLVRKDDGWTVQERANFPASFEQVGGLLRKLWELKTVQEVKVGASQLGRLELTDKATVVTFHDKDGKALNSVILGKKHMRESEGDAGFPGMPGGFAVGRYVKPGSGQQVSLVSETLDEASVKPESWLAKDFLKIEGPKSISVSGPHTWSISRDSATATEWKLADAKPDEKTDTNKTSPFANVFASASFVDVQAPNTKLEEPVTTAIIETFDGFRYEVKIGKPVDENYPVVFKITGNFAKERIPGKDEKAEDKTRLDAEFAANRKKLEEKLATEKKVEGRPYLVAKYAVEALLKDRAGLLPDKPADPAPAATGSSATLSTPSAATAPAMAPTPPMTAPKTEATTPPVQVPPPAPASAATPTPAPAPPAAVGTTPPKAEAKSSSATPPPATTPSATPAPATSSPTPAPAPASPATPAPKP